MVWNIVFLSFILTFESKKDYGQRLYIPYCSLFRNPMAVVCPVQLRAIRLWYKDSRSCEAKSDDPVIPMGTLSSLRTLPST